MVLYGITGRENHRPCELSGGEQQRVVIARAIITSPKILLADEPTGNLDYNTALDILKLFQKMNKELGQSTIIVTHDPMVKCSVGDTINIAGKELMVSEIIEDNTMSESSIAMAIMTQSTLAQLTGEKDISNFIMIKGKNNVSTNTVVKKIQNLGHNLELILLFLLNYSYISHILIN